MRSIEPLVKLAWILFAIPSFLQAQDSIQWSEREDFTISLPPSVRIYEGSGLLSDGEPVRALYALVDLRDDNLSLRAVGSNTHRETTLDAYLSHQGILAVNGGYFSSNASISLLISDGEVIAPGPNKGTARGAFGLVNRKPAVVWPHENGPGEEMVLLENPAAAAHLGSLPAWRADQAVGGGPVLIKEGKLGDYGKEEGFGGSHLARHPRTAIGYLDENTVLMLVVDGRQEASVGVTLEELANIMMDLGCYEAVNLDGGGSSVMVAADEVVNIPADIPGGNRNSLRKNASALILSEISPTPPREMMILDTDSPTYSEKGIWKDSNHANHYGNTPSRVANASNEFNLASYSFENIPSKRYQLASWWTVNSSSNSNEVLFLLHHGGKVDSLVMDQTSLPTGGKWNVLGNYLLGPTDRLDIMGKGKEGKMVVDALRLVAIDKPSHDQHPPKKESPTVHIEDLEIKRGDLRIAVISDLNSGLGAADYEWQVDSIIQRIPRLWSPDLVICGGDMVAGMGISDEDVLKKMWNGFDDHIAQPLRNARIPFAFTLGNHDGPRSYPLEQEAARRYWQNTIAETGLEFVDSSHFPNYYSFVKDEVFFISWEASSPEITPENLEWMERQFELSEAKKARYRFVMGHMPLYAVAQERDSKGNILEKPEKLRQLLQQYNVHTYISGHQHAYYPGKRGNLELLNAGAAGSGPRGWLGLDLAPQNTLTIMDVFYEADSIVYTTFDIREKDASQMKIIEEQKLPTAVFGVSGHLIRRDIQLADEVTGIFMFAQNKKFPLKIRFQGNQMEVSGSLPKEIPTPTLAFYKGRNSEKGELLHQMTLNTKRNGSYVQKLHSDNDWQEWASSGAVFAELEWGDNQVIKTQLYHMDNLAPAAPKIISHHQKNVYGVRDIEALYEISWEKVQDPEGDFVTYLYQMARDREFEEIILEKETSRVNHLKMLESDWYRNLEEAEEGEIVEFYHRVLASDGRNINPAHPTSIRLMKSHENLDDYIEVPAPKYEFHGKIENASGAGYGAVWDQEGKLWLADYHGKLVILNDDGSEAPFSPLKSVEINGESYSLNPVNGIGLDQDGNLLVGRNRHLLKINTNTGKGLAVWEVPKGNRAITSPRANDKGEIYAMSLFAEDGNYVLTQKGATFELLRKINLPDRVLARTFDMTNDGLTFFFPNPGSPYVQTYSSTDGINYQKEEDISSIAAGSNAISISSTGKLYFAVRESGIMPSTFHFRDDEQRIMWTLELPEVSGAEARGIGVSPDGKTLIFCSYDKGGGFYKYTLK